MEYRNYLSLKAANMARIVKIGGVPYLILVGPPAVERLSNSELSDARQRLAEARTRLQEDRDGIDAIIADISTAAEV
jgi:hypothetical protein